MNTRGTQRRVFGMQKGNRRFFSEEDDQTLRRFKSMKPELSWTSISEQMPGFSPRQLRERWYNYLSPSLNTADWTSADDANLLELHESIGPRWGEIGRIMGNRAGVDIKNRFQSVWNKRQQEIRNRRRECNRARRHAKAQPPEAPTSAGNDEERARDNGQSQKADNPESSERASHEKHDAQDQTDFSIKSLLA
jgi:DNA-binding transcriptional MerR regulator